jgi:NADH:ubiquinone oxidoreductase subunit 5 (subunit L)/multisubunit Na+/H+ antiporter MnhA subunit
MVAGVIYEALGHDGMAGLAGVGRALPITLLAFALAGVALIGVPPSGAYLAKTLLLEAAGDTAQWWWAVVVQAGGILTSGYVLMVLAHAVVPAEHPVKLSATVPRIREAAALARALVSLLLGPWHTYLPFPEKTLINPPALETLWSLLWPILVGGGMTILIGHWQLRFPGLPNALVASVDRARRAALVLVGGTVAVDATLRRWPAAGLTLSTMAVIFGIAMPMGH